MQVLWNLCQELAACFLLIFGIITISIAYRVYQIPKAIYKAHADLRSAIRAVNRGDPSLEEYAMFINAYCSGMVGVCGMSINTYGKPALKYCYNSVAADMFYDGIYGYELESPG